MVVSGECPIMDGARYRRFKKEIEIPSYYNENAIRASFMPSILKVVIPKKASLISQRDQERQIIPEFEPKKVKEKESSSEEENQSMEFKGRGTGEDTNAKGNERVEDTEGEEEEIEGKGGELTPETTREVCFKILVVVTVILVIGSYVIDTCKSIMADS